MTKKHKHKKILLSLVILLAIFDIFSFKSLFNTKVAQAQFTQGGAGISIISGCTNPRATNYNPQATSDDGSCIVGNPQDLGDILGYAWSASTDAPYSGVGWLNFNCKTAPEVVDENSNRPSNGDGDPCNDAAGDWGVKMNTDHTSQLGELSGYAWSDNLGWLSFNPSDTVSCFSNTSNPAYQHSAKVEGFGSSANGETLDITGWARFMSADQAGDNSGDWDGCVSFKGDNISGSPSYSTTITVPSGELAGYAWGSSVVGWIAFDCNGCDTHVVLGSAYVNLSAENTYVPTGGSTTLHWQANSNVAICSTYQNSNNYPDWHSGVGGAPSTPSSISLPNGSTDVSGITADTTYTLNCKDNLGQAVPTASVTVMISDISGCTIETDPNYDPLATIPDNSACADTNTIMGCTDSTAFNYNPNATDDDGSCVPTVVGCMDSTATNYNPQANVPARCTFNSPELTLSATPNSLALGSPVNNVTLNWTSNNTSSFTGTSCSGSVTRDHSGAVLAAITIPGWSGSGLHLPDYSKAVNLTNAMSSATLGDQFTFKISCNSNTGLKTAQASVSVTDGPIVGCTDSTAFNYNPNATDDDGSCVPTIVGCMDSTASNYNPAANVPAPCTEGPPVDVIGCMDSTASNYNPQATVPGRCTYPSVNLTLSASPSVLTTGSPSYPPIYLEWASDNPSALSGTCTGSTTLQHGASLSTIAVPGWANGLLLPTNHKDVFVSNWMTTAVAGDRFNFKITCNLSTGGTVTSPVAVVNVQGPPPPGAPAVGLQILLPNNSPTDLWHEEIPQAGLDDTATPANPFVLQWQAQNVTSCTGTSDIYPITATDPNDGPTDNNINWNNRVLDHDMSGQTNYSLSFGILGSAINNTLFHITCIPLNTSFGTEVQSTVCMNVAGRNFPQCPVNSSGGTPPTYQEI